VFTCQRGGPQKPKVVSMPKRKTMSAAARKKIAAAQRLSISDGKNCNTKLNGSVFTDVLQVGVLVLRGLRF